MSNTVFNLVLIIALLFGFEAKFVFAQNRTSCDVKADFAFPFNNPCQTLLDLTTLSSDTMQGRAPSTQGQQRASNYIIEQFKSIGLLPVSQLGLMDTDGFKQVFQYDHYGTATTGENILGFQRGEQYPNQVLIITAHYDHLGTKGKRIMNGADDNASGVAGLLAIARFFSVLAPNYSILYVATDAEEHGLHGARYFLENWNSVYGKPSLNTDLIDPPIEIKMNINLDMIGGTKGNLYFTGARKNQAFLAIFDTVTQQIGRKHIRLKRGHGSARLSRDALSGNIDWRNASDHAVFRKQGIPYLYLGGDLHDFYHTSDDTIDNIDQNAFMASVKAALMTVILLDGLPSQYF